MWQEGERKGTNQREAWKLEKNLWIYHNCLIRTIGVKRKNVVRYINLCLLRNFILSFQNLYTKTMMLSATYHCFPQTRHPHMKPLNWFMCECLVRVKKRTCSKPHKHVQQKKSSKDYKPQYVITSRSTSIAWVWLTAFKTSNRTLAVWYAFVSCALKNCRNLLSNTEITEVCSRHISERQFSLRKTHRSALSAAFCKAWIYFL